ncbi:hypothetical protein [Streptomyces marianii]|uniref:hypothetical protein n=1 Tax=Streptomyces marianii TaxID=1817406 RepID=UPI001F476F7E|nr:hypothetical protein [Streptomyces marianii]
MSSAQQRAEEKPQRVSRLDTADLPATAPLTETGRFAAGSGEECTATAPGSKERRAVPSSPV